MRDLAHVERWIVVDPSWTGSAGTSRNTVTCDRRASSGRFAATYRRNDATDAASPRSSASRW